MQHGHIQVFGGIVLSRSKICVFFSLLNRIITYQGIYHSFLIPVPLQITGEMVEIEERHLKVMTRSVSVDKIQYSNKYEGVGATKFKQL